jgi:hypothetical protein
MARSKQNKVDWFPHVVKDGKTIYMLESKYGNDGYSFWFKLLSEIGLTENHVLDFRQEEVFDYFISKARVSKEIAIQILDDLSRWKNIDSDLWNEFKIVWCQNLVDNVSEVYRKRKREIPSKPNFCDRNTITPVQSATEIPHSRVEESTGEESTGECSGGKLPQEINFKYQIGSEEIYDLDEYFFKTFQMHLTNLKKQYGELKIKKWIAEFSSLHNEKTWIDSQDFRSHISKYFIIQEQNDNKITGNRTQKGLSTTLKTSGAAGFGEL